MLVNISFRHILHLAVETAAIQTKSSLKLKACEGLNPLVRVGELSFSLCSREFSEAVGEFGKPNPPAPFPAREGGAGKPLSS